MGKIVKLSISLILFFTILIAEIAVGLYIHYAATIPKIPLFQQVALPQAVEVRSQEGHVLAIGGDQYRYSVNWKDVPKNLINAFVASEDASFFRHGGLDFKGILRAFLIDLFSGKARQGGSTITQQVARNLLLTLKKSMSRKVREAILARRIEDVYTKDEILLLYMNLLYLGEGTYGIKAAARQYFHKDLGQLTLGECAILAALAQSPSRVNPVKDPAGTLKKRNRVLRRMLATGRITKQAYEQALKEPMHGFAPQDDDRMFAPWVTQDALQEARQVLKDTALWKYGGLRIWTTPSLGFELAAEQALVQGVMRLNRKQGFRGPVGHVPAGQVQQAIHALSAMEVPGQGLTLGLVLSVQKRTADMVLAGGKQVTMRLKDNRWAGSYQEFRKRKGRYRPGRISFKRRLRDFRKALRRGDVVFIRPLKKGFRLARRYGMQGALCAMEPCTGDMLALVGGTDFDVSQFDRTRARRQTGSSIKPIYYSKAYEASIPPSMVFSGVPVRIKKWSPDTEANLRDMTLWEALTVSENNISLRLYQHLLSQIGLDALRSWYQKLGLPGLPSGFPAQALGIDESPRGLLTAYSVFACHGRKAKGHTLALVTDKDGRILYDARQFSESGAGPLDSLFLLNRDTVSSQPVMGRDVAYLIAANLRNIVLHGTGRRAAHMKHPAFGKTGTLPFDVWFVGWTHQVASIAWIGADHRERYLGASRKHGVHGADTALPVWKAFQESVTRDMPVEDDMKDVPDGVVWVNIDPDWGVLTTAAQGISIPHLIGTQPQSYMPQPGGNMDELIQESMF